MWYGLMFDVLGHADDAAICVASLDVPGRLGPALAGARRSFVAYNPTAEARSFKVTFGEIGAGRYRLNDQAFTAEQLRDGVAMSLPAGGAERWDLQRVEPIEPGGDASERHALVIEYARLAAAAQRGGSAELAADVAAFEKRLAAFRASGR
jgi:hypothetical protein